MLVRAVRKIGSPAIRNRGTVGGSAAHADPAAEIPAVLVALNATVMATGPAGTREIAARRFYRYAYETDLALDEIVTGLRVPLPGEDQATGAAFYEVAIPNHNERVRCTTFGSQSAPSALRRSVPARLRR